MLHIDAGVGHWFHINFGARHFRKLFFGGSRAWVQQAPVSRQYLDDIFSERGQVLTLGVVSAAVLACDVLMWKKAVLSHAPST